MRLPRKGVTTVAIAVAIAAAGGGLLARSMVGSKASPSLATEASVLTLLNQQRVSHGLRPLALDTKLTQAAKSHSVDMMRRGYFAHDGPQGVWDVRIRRHVRRAVVGEVLEYGAGQYATASGIVNAWMHSSAHRRVILAPDFKLIGIAIVLGTFQGQRGVAVATGDLSSKS